MALPMPLAARAAVSSSASLVGERASSDSKNLPLILPVALPLSRVCERSWQPGQFLAKQAVLEWRSTRQPKRVQANQDQKGAEDESCPSAHKEWSVKMTVPFSEPPMDHHLTANATRTSSVVMQRTNHTTTMAHAHHQDAVPLVMRSQAVTNTTEATLATTLQDLWLQPEGGLLLCVLLGVIFLLGLAGMAGLLRRRRVSRACRELEEFRAFKRELMMTNNANSHMASSSTTSSVSSCSSHHHHHHHHLYNSRSDVVTRRAARNAIRPTQAWTGSITYTSSRSQSEDTTVSTVARSLGLSPTNNSDRQPRVLQRFSLTSFDHRMMQGDSDDEYEEEQEEPRPLFDLAKPSVAAASSSSSTSSSTESPGGVAVKTTSLVSPPVVGSLFAGIAASTETNGVFRTVKDGSVQKLIVDLPPVIGEEATRDSLSMSSDHDDDDEAWFADAMDDESFHSVFMPPGSTADAVLLSVQSDLSDYEGDGDMFDEYEDCSYEQDDDEDGSSSTSSSGESDSDSDEQSRESSTLQVFWARPSNFSLPPPYQEVVAVKSLGELAIVKSPPSSPLGSARKMVDGVLLSPDQQVAVVNRSFSPRQDGTPNIVQFAVDVTPPLSLPRKNSRGSLCSMASLASVVTNCEVEVDGEGMVVATSPRKLARRSSQRLSMSSSHNDLSASFHQTVETLLQSLMLSDSEDDDTEAGDNDSDDESLDGVGHFGYDMAMGGSGHGLGLGDEDDQQIVLGERRNHEEHQVPTQPVSDWRSAIVPADKLEPPRRRQQKRGSSRRRLSIEESSATHGLVPASPMHQDRRLSSSESSLVATMISQALSPAFKTPDQRSKRRVSRHEQPKSSSERRLSLPTDTALVSKQRRVSFHPDEQHHFEEDAMVVRRLFVEGDQEGEGDVDSPPGTPPEAYMNESSTPDKKSKLNKRTSPTSVRALLLEDGVSQVECSDAPVQNVFVGEMNGVPEGRMDSLEDSLHGDSLRSQSLRRRSSRFSARFSALFSASMSTLKTDTDMNGYSQSLLDLNEDEEFVHDAVGNEKESGRPVIANIDMVERHCTSDSHRRKLKNARLVVRVVLGAHRKDYKTSKACFQAIDTVTAFRKEIYQAVLEMSKGGQVLADLRSCWQQLWRQGDSGAAVFPALPKDPRTVDNYEYSMLLLRKIYTMLYPEATPASKPNTYPSHSGELMSSHGPEENMTLFLGSIGGLPVSLSLSSFDTDRTKRTRLTPYKSDERYPLSLQDAMRVVRAVLGPSHKRVSGQDCLRAIQMYGLLKIQFKRLSQQLEEQRAFVAELNSELEQVVQDLHKVTSRGDNDNQYVPNLISHIGKRLPPQDTMDAQESSIVAHSDRIHQLLCDEDN